MNVLLVGGGGREHAIACALKKSSDVKLFVVMGHKSPGMVELATAYLLHSERDIRAVVDWASNKDIQFAVVGFEEPLALGLCDALGEAGIASIGPRKDAAQLEASKLFTRGLMEKHGIPGRVEYRRFADLASVKGFLWTANREFAIKPIGLTSGKGVRVMGDQLKSVEEALAYAREVLEKGVGGRDGVILEERLIGEEFTLQCFVDGEIVVPMPVVRDFKRAYEGDKGPNTGGMGSYSQENGLLPFLTYADRDKALDIIERVIRALRSDGIVYKGILYGQFMLTREGLKLVEFNARFGDPEAMNVLPILETDFVDCCQAIIDGTLNRLRVRFSPKATVCKYVTPQGYPLASQAGRPLRVDRRAIEQLGARLFYSKVDQEGDHLLTTESRALAVLGTGDSVNEAEAIAEQALTCVSGDYHVRHDIGKPASLTSAGLMTAAKRAHAAA